MTDEDICNQALGAIAARYQINSLNDESTAAQACKLYYATVRDAMLGQAMWNFGRFQRLLALLKDGTQGDLTVPAPWTYEYSYPTDCIQCRYIMPTYANSPVPSGAIPGVLTSLGPPVRFIVASDDDTNGTPINVILSNQPQANLVYTRRITNPALFSATFVCAMVGAMAARLCVPLSGNLKMTQLAVNEGKAALLAAQASDGNEGITVQDVTPDWMRVRGYLSDWATPDYFNFAGDSSQLWMIN